MDYITDLLDKLKEWANKLIEILVGSEPQPEQVLIPIPVRDKR